MPLNRFSNVVTFFSGNGKFVITFRLAMYGALCGSFSQKDKKLIRFTTCSTMINKNMNTGTNKKVGHLEHFSRNRLRHNHLFR